MGWWPGDGPFDVLVGAILTQRMNWRTVEVAVERLKGAGVSDVASLLELPLERLEGLIRSTGTYRQKARRLRALCELASDGGRRTLEEFLARPAGTLRSELLSVKGIGPETADSIVLYAAGHPVFVVDAYTRRVLFRLGVETGDGYDDVARWFTSAIPEDPGLYNNYHALIVRLGTEHCRTRPRCAGCPLLDVCPTGVQR